MFVCAFYKGCVYVCDDVKVMMYVYACMYAYVCVCFFMSTPLPLYQKKKKSLDKTLATNVVHSFSSHLVNGTFF